MFSSGRPIAEMMMMMMTHCFYQPEIKVDRKVLAAAVGEQHDLTVKYTCDDCELTEILCRGESVLNQGRFTIIPTSKEVSVRFVGFEDSMSCVYMGIFKAGDTVYGKSLVILESKYKL
nr:uncharacterized protein LOC126054468 [Helicoverpa armigera]